MNAVRYAEFDPSIPLCGRCGNEVEFEECHNCGGEGGRDLYEEDPLSYAPDDWAECEECRGNGTLPWCPDCGPLRAVTFRPLIVVESDAL